MFKVVYLLKRKDGMGLEEFKRYWLEKHAPLVLKLPNLKRYSINVSTRDGAEFDGIAELWFESREKMKEAFKTDEGRAVVEDASAFVGKNIVLEVEEHAIL